MNKTAISTQIGVFVGAVAFCVGVTSAQQPMQPAAFRPATPPFQAQAPVQAQPAPPQPVAYQPAMAPVQQQPPPPSQENAPQQQGVGPVQGQPTAQPAGGAGKSVASKSDVVDAESSARLGVELSAEALAAAPYLYYDRGKSPGVGRVAFPEDHYVYQRFDKVTVTPIGKELPLKTGDTVDVLRPLDKVKVGGERTRLVARVARGVVLGFAERNAVVSLIDMWGKVVGAERVVPSTPFIPVYLDNKPASGGENIKATVILHLDRSVTPSMHQYIILDKGSEAGVKVGDFFRVMDRERSYHIPAELVEAQVLSVTAKASTLVLQKVYKERLRYGDEAYLSFRAVAK